MDLNNTSERDYVPEIERQIRFRKERARTTLIMMTLSKIPGRTIVELINQTLVCLNASPQRAVYPKL